MRFERLATAMLLGGLAACNQPAPQEAVRNEVDNQPAAASAPGLDLNRVANVSLPDDRTPLEEPKGPINPKSAEAAGQVVQRYAALIEQGRWTESWKLWSDAATAKAFDRNWRNASEVHMEIGKPGDMEGAAGSSYVTVPAIFYGKEKSSAEYRRDADVILRRVNDVPGSTEAQRRWHIERVEWKAPA